MLHNIIYTLTKTNIYLGYITEVVGSQYDRSPLLPAHTLAFSSTYFALSNASATINPTKDQKFGLTSLGKTDLLCDADSNCYYLGDNPSNDIDWAAYDTYYDGLMTDLRDIIDIFNASALVDTRFEIY